MKKLIKPEVPLDWEMKSLSIYLSQGKSLQEVLNDLPEEVDKTKLIFDIRPTYYDDFDYEFVGEYRRKFSKKEYARKIIQYEKALKKYNEQEERIQKHGK